MQQYKDYFESIKEALYQNTWESYPSGNMIVLLPPYCKQQAETDIIKQSTGGWNVNLTDGDLIIQIDGFKVIIKFIGYEKKFVMYRQMEYEPSPIIMKLPYSEKTVFKTVKNS